MNIALRESAAISRTRATSRTLNAFVIGQVAVTTVLLVGAILLGRTYVNTESVDPGIDIRNTLAISLDWDQTGLDRNKGRLFYEQLLERVSTLPGVQHAALTRHVPLSPGGPTAIVLADGSSSFTANTAAIAGGYFDAVGLPLLLGRDFSPLDNGGHAVAIVNETMARQLSATASPLGTVFEVGTTTRRKLEVIGVAKDAKFQSLTEGRRAVFYEPFAQAYSPQMTLLARSRSELRQLADQIRREMALRNSDLAAITIRTLEEQLEESAAPSRQRALILGVTCGLGLLLSASGLFGVMSYGVRVRIRELGVRMAVGAEPKHIGFIVLRQAFRIVGTGLAAGLLLSFAASRLIASVLFGVSPNDPLTLAGVILVLATVAAVAAYLPARWAMRVDPMRSIREN
jgi:predicted permease